MMNSAESGENPCSELDIPHYKIHALFRVCTKLGRASHERGVNQTREPLARFFSSEFLH